MFAASKSGQSTVAVTTDPYFKYVPLLLETTTTNGQQNNTFLDSSTNNFTITRNGTPTQGSVTPYWPDGYWSNNFPSATNQYLSTAYNAAFNFASSTAFTIEFWFNTTGFSGAHTFISNYNGATTGWAMQFRADAGNIFRFALGNTNIIDSSAQTISAGVWYHFALVRNASNSISMYLNGTSIATPVTNSGAFAATTQGPWIGGLPAVGQYYPGYISNLRVVNGTGVYTGAFTPPTTPLTAVTNTVLLTCQSNRFKDNSTNNFTLTPTNTPRVQAFQPFSPPASYTTAAYGGSGYFNGSTDYLTSAATAALDLTSGDWTIQGWYYPTSYSSSNNVIAYIGSATGNKLVVATIGTAGNLYYLLNGSVTISSATAAPLNAWSFYALVKSGATTTLYLNGVSLGTTTSVPTTSNKSLSLGSDAGASIYQGYFGDFRVLKGTASSTVPTAPVTAITNTSLLLNFTNAGIYDAAVQNNAITVGSAQASTTVAKWSPTSMKFNGTSDYLDLGTNQAFVMGSGDWTVEGWVYPTATTAGHWMYLQGNASAFAAIRIGCQSNQVFLLISTNGTTNTVSSGLVGSVPNNAWTYLAVTRSGTTVTLYVNGTSVYTSTALSTSALMTGTYNLVGRIDPTNLQYFTGYLQDVRITKGYARTITTPTAAFPTR